MKNEKAIQEIERNAFVSAATNGAFGLTAEKANLLADQKYPLTVKNRESFNSVVKSVEWSPEIAEAMRFYL